MSVLLATGLSQVEERLEKEGMWRCHHRSVLIEVVQETKSDVIVISPHLKGDDDLFEIIKVLRKSNIRVIFLPGTTGMQDTSEWVKQLLPWGVYCYVFDPVTPGKILERIKNPGKIIDLPTAMTNVAELPDEEIPALPAIPEVTPVSLLSKFQKLLLSIFNSNKKSPKPIKSIKPLALPQPEQPPAPKVQVQEAVKTEKPPKTRQAWFSKTGIITEGKFSKMKFDDYNNIEVPYDALVVPASVGIKYIKKYRREHPWKPVVVLKGNQSFIDAGADKCVKKINKSVIEEMTHLNKVIQDLWKHTETDPLTGLYTRTFLDNWRTNRESRNKIYTAVMLDIDNFKTVNDTYGHEAGDAVLSTLGEFLKSEARMGDVIARYGGEEFIICMPDTIASDGYILVDRLRSKWAERTIVLPDNRIVKTTFSAGVAEWQQGQDVIKVADKMLYEAKNSGRNRVISDNTKVRVLILGKIAPTEFRNNNIDITYDPDIATVVVADKDSYTLSPENLPLYIVIPDAIVKWHLQRELKTANVVQSVEEAVSQIKGKPKLQVLPGVRSYKNTQTIPLHGVVYIICPSRPAAASEVAVKLSSMINNIGFVCASGASTSAKLLGINDKKLITADWRIHRSEAPVYHNGITVWPVDPFKHITTRYDIHKLVDQIKSSFDLVIVDCAGNLDLCQRIAHDEGVILLYKEGDSSDEVTANWAKTLKSQSIMSISASEEPNIIEAENGFIITGQGTVHAARQ